MRFFFFTLAVVSALPSFDEWRVMFNKEYSNEDYEYRSAVYAETISQIQETNAQNLSWTAGVNEYSDLTWAEFERRFLGGVDPQKCSATAKYGKPVPTDGKPLPATVDWVAAGKVTAVKNQGSCGSCWAFSTTGAVESAWAIAGKPLGMLAEQQLVDCAGGFKNNGCRGGLPSQAFQYLMWAGGQQDGASYKYTAKDGKCQFKKDKVVAVLKDEHNVTAKDESDTGMPAGIAKQPVSVCYQVASDFRNYKSGVYDSKVCKNGPMDVNHAVLATGYGEEGGKPYYNCKNSWGTSFGIKGYFKILRGKNMCGIAVCSSYPIVA